MCYDCSFNSCLENMSVEWYCRDCSKRFHSFFRRTLIMNTNFLESTELFMDENSNDSKEYLTETVEAIMAIKCFFKNLNYYRSTKHDESDIFMYNNRYLRLPNLMNDDRKWLDLYDLKKIYILEMAMDKVDSDLILGEFTITRSKLDELESSYKRDFSYPNASQYIQNELVYSKKYTNFQQYLFNYLRRLYCDECKKKLYERVGESLYLESACLSIKYNLFSRQKYALRLLENDMIFHRDMLISIMNNDIRGINIPDYLWRGKNRYFQLMFVLSKDLLKAKIPKIHYVNRNVSVFHDAIIGHPKASHGTFSDALDKMEDMGAFKNKQKV